MVTWVRPAIVGLQNCCREILKNEINVFRPRPTLRLNVKYDIRMKPDASSAGANPEELHDAVRERADYLELVNASNRPEHGLMSRVGMLIGHKHSIRGCSALSPIITRRTTAKKPGDA